MALSRRDFLLRSSLIGCSLAASPLITPMSFAAAPWDTRLVVIILRGGMDGVGVIQPYGDPQFAKLRPTAATGVRSGSSHDLDGFFALHEGLAPLMPLWAAGELGFVHAVSTPYRDKRSHFDGQDLLEAGTVGMEEVRDGWLNRVLQLTPQSDAHTAFAIGSGEMKILQGSAPVSDWSPDSSLVMSPQAERLAGLLMEADPLFHSALEEALDLSRAGGDLAMSSEGGMEENMMSVPKSQKGKGHVNIADYAAEQLRGEARIASFSINGWDTHSRQERVLKGALGRLSDTILTLRGSMGPEIWGKTAVVAVTEFGRTARINGTAGTDHGTGGAMLLAGGAIRGGRVYGRWPGLDEASLYQRRDLLPTEDVRASLAWIMRGVTGLDTRQLEQTIFPGLSMGANQDLLR